MSEPLPCPFCGAAPQWLSKRMDFGTTATGMEAPMRALGCNNCSVYSRTAWRDTAKWQEGRSCYYVMNYDEQAIAEWNKRHPSSDNGSAT